MEDISIGVAVREENLQIYKANPHSIRRGILLTFTLELFKIQQNKSFSFLM